MKLLRGFAVILAAVVLAGIPVLAQHTQSEEPDIWLIVDGTAIGTVEPGTFEYHYGNEIRVDTNELVYGCSQDRIFWDRYEAKP